MSLQTTRVSNSREIADIKGDFGTFFGGGGDITARGIPRLLGFPVKGKGGTPESLTPRSPEDERRAAVLTDNLDFFREKEKPQSTYSKQERRDPGIGTPPLICRGLRNVGTTEFPRKFLARSLAKRSIQCQIQGTCQHPFPLNTSNRFPNGDQKRGPSRG